MPRTQVRGVFSPFKVDLDFYGIYRRALYFAGSWYMIRASSAKAGRTKAE
jgi:hypothetical protein